MGPPDVAAATAVQRVLPAPGRVSDIRSELAGFSFNGEKTVVEMVDGVDYFINEFWTARQRQAHSIHEVSYRACFKPQLPEFFIARLTEPGDLVLDPFMGRGTTLIQAALMGRTPVGNDINPLSVLLTRPRLRPPGVGEVQRRLEAINWAPPRVNLDEDLLVFYHPDTLGELYALRAHFRARRESGDYDAVDDWIQMVALNRLSGHSPGFFSVYSLPPNQAVSVEAQRKINAKRDQTPPRRSVPAIILKKTRALLKDRQPSSAHAPILTTAKADAMAGIETASIALVVTSPPFLDIVQYAADNWLRCWFADIDVGAVEISMHRKPEAWRDFVAATFRELARVVKPGGHVAFEVGEVRNGSIKLESLVIAAVDPRQFSVEAVMVNVQAFTKTANCWGVENNGKGTNTNRVVILKRTAREARL